MQAPECISLAAYAVLTSSNPVNFRVPKANGQLPGPARSLPAGFDRVVQNLLRETVFPLGWRSSGCPNKHAHFPLLVPPGGGSARGDSSHLGHNHGLILLAP